MAKKPETAFDFDLTKMLGDYKLPGVDVESVVASQRKNLEALTAANRMAYEGVQAVVQRQSEILRQMMEEVSGAAKQMTEAGTPQEKAARQAELVKDAFERALANMRELSEMVARSNGDAIELLNRRFTQGMEEWRDLFLTPKK